MLPLIKEIVIFLVCCLHISTIHTLELLGCLLGWEFYVTPGVRWVKFLIQNINFIQQKESKYVLVLVCAYTQWN